MQSLRDNPESRAAGVRPHPRRGRPGISPVLTFDPADDLAAPFIARGARPPIAILREQGVNGEVEMAAAFDRAGLRGARRPHERHHRGPRVARGVPRLRGLRRLLVRRRAGRRRGLGEVDPLSRPRPRRVRGVLRATRHLRARRVQRLPDDGGAQGAHPRRGRVAAVRQEHVASSSRRASSTMEIVASPSLFFRGHGGQPHPRGRRRTARGARSSTRDAARAR